MTIRGVPGAGEPQLPAPMVHATDEPVPLTLTFIGIELDSGLNLNNQGATVLLSGVTIGSLNLDCNLIRISDCKHSLEGSLEASELVVNSSTLGGLTVGATEIKITDSSCINLSVTSGESFRAESFECYYGMGLQSKHNKIFNSKIYSKVGGIVEIAGDVNVLMYSEINANDLRLSNENVLVHNSFNGTYILLRKHGNLIYGNNQHDNRRHGSDPGHAIFGHQGGSHDIEIINNTFHFSAHSHGSKNIIFWEKYEAKRVFFANNLIRDGRSMRYDDFLSLNAEWTKENITGDGNWCNRRPYENGYLKVSHGEAVSYTHLTLPTSDLV